MAKRQSMIKHLSRLNISSRGSAGIDSDTSILGSEDQNQNTMLASIDYISTSESKEEYEVIKKKLHFRANARSDKGNAFLNAFNDSVATTMDDIIPTVISKSSMNNAASNDETLTSFEDLDKMEENSLSRSQGASDVLKSKPEIFKINHKIQNRNTFAHILETWQPSKFSRRMYAGVSVNNKSRIIASMNLTNVNTERMRKSKMQCTSDANISTNRKDRSTVNVEDKLVNELETSTATEFLKDTVQNNGNEPKGVSDSSVPLHPTSNIQRIENHTRNSLLSTSKSNTLRGQQSIFSFFNADSLDPTLQVFSDEQHMANVKKELEKLKAREMNHIMKKRANNSMKPCTQKKATERAGKRPRIEQQTQRVTKQVHRAYMVNGQVYKVPRKPRPKPWVTDHLYKHLWKCMEPKYNLATRMVSEKFVQQLTDITTVIRRRKSYVKYKTELDALMKEMARLGIIRTPKDFYQFCHEFFPYELRIKMVPMLLPGNVRNIPYDMNKLNEPVLDF